MTTKKSNSNAVIVFMKDAVPGEVKTRIGQHIGMSKAADVYLRLLEDTRLILVDFPADIWLFVNKSPDSFQPWREENCYIDTQSGGDLGKKMLHAFQKIQHLYESVLLIGTDCPDLDKQILSSAFLGLENHQLVLGPAHDGGYYLIGSRNIYANLFQDIPWSTDKVLQKTMDKAKTLGLSICLLPELRDIDTLQDLNYYTDLGYDFAKP